MAKGGSSSGGKSKGGGGGWVTINGAHVLIGANGKISKGPAKFIGSTLADLKVGSVTKTRGTASPNSGSVKSSTYKKETVNGTAKKGNVVTSGSSKVTYPTSPTSEKEVRDNFNKAFVGKPKETGYHYTLIYDNYVPGKPTIRGVAEIKPNPKERTTFAVSGSPPKSSVPAPKDKPQASSPVPTKANKAVVSGSAKLDVYEMDMNKFKKVTKKEWEAAGGTNFVHLDSFGRRGSKNIYYLPRT